MMNNFLKKFYSLFFIVGSCLVFCSDENMQPNKNNVQQKSAFSLFLDFSKDPKFLVRGNNGNTQENYSNGQSSNTSSIENPGHRQPLANRQNNINNASNKTSKKNKQKKVVNTTEQDVLKKEQTQGQGGKKLTVKELTATVQLLQKQIDYQKNDIENLRSHIVDVESQVNYMKRAWDDRGSEADQEQKKNCK